MKPTDRALSVFEAFEAAERPLTLSELAEAAGIPVSTCHGVVGVLMQRGYLYLTSRQKDLYPTRRLFDMAAGIGRHDPFLERLEPLLESLRDATHETVVVGKRQQDHVVYLSVLEGPQTIRFSARAGDRKPLHSTSLGKALISAMGDVQLLEWVGETQFSAITPRTLTSAPDLLKDVRAGRKRGYFVTRGESVSDVLGIAVPIALHNDLIAVAVAGPMHRMEQRVGAIAKQLLAARDELEKL